MSSPAYSSRPQRKVIFLSAELEQVGGIADYNRRLLDGLRSNGVEVALVERRAGGFLAKAVFLFRILVSAFTIHPGFILCTHLNFAPAGRILWKALGIPYGIVVYGVEIPNAKNSYPRKCLQDSSLVIHLFDHAIERLERWVPGIRSKAFSLMSAVDGDRFKVLPRSESLVRELGLEGRTVLLTLCRVSKADGENKGYRRVLEALPKVLQAVPGVVYILAGGGDDLEDVRALVRSLGISSNVILPGPLPAERVVDYYNLADLFVLPSKEEGFPAIVLLEALACGVPVVGGNQPGAEAALLDGELGWVVPHDDADQIADALIRAIKEPPPAWSSREVLRERALALYGKQRYSREVSALVGRIAEVLAQ